MDQNHSDIAVPVSSGRPQRVIVVGAGIAGLTAAYYLNKLGLEVHVFDGAGRAGGLVQTRFEKERYLVEYGPSSHPAKHEHLEGLSRELSIDRFELTGRSRRQFIYSDGSLHQVPTTLLKLMSSRLITSVGKMRVLAEPFVRSHSKEGETVAQFLRRRVGEEFLDNVAAPFIANAWAGDPEVIELKASNSKLLELEEKYGSIAKGAFKEKDALSQQDVVSFRWGMGTLPARMQEVLGKAIHLKTAVKNVGFNERGNLVVTFQGHDEQMAADAVIVATNASAASPLIATVAPRAAQLASNITSAPLAVVHTAFNRRDIPMRVNGKGILVPRLQSARSLGVLFSGALFEHRSPDGEVLLTSYIGGSTDPDALNLDDEEMVNVVRRDLHITMGISDKPTYMSIKRIKEAIPQYAVGHTRRIFDIDQSLDQVPGVFLTGNYLGGIGVPDVIDHARRTAMKVRAWLRRTDKGIRGSGNMEEGDRETRRSETKAEQAFPDVPIF